MSHLAKPTCYSRVGVAIICWGGLCNNPPPEPPNTPITHLGGLLRYYYATLGWLTGSGLLCMCSHLPPGKKSVLDSSLGTGWSCLSPFFSLFDSLEYNNITQIS